MTFKLTAEDVEDLGQEQVCVLGEEQHYSQGNKRNNDNDSSDVDNSR